ncbi:MAG: helix-turn-helix transcriptional regulator [Polaromonas sp.]|uniref:helix-turn-helix transcriptional regulator n=1 Tax=Polaromonas sp. TaxID=1869339 RepID=UPI0025E3D06D|nr:helix-turn-helix transcriptional regulator [Polaromonas sp.]MBI2727663.1 helix-turn-helix transcriptional regulator [Polaromonas sp.]
MPRVHLPLSPSLTRLARSLGQRLQLARCRRELSTTVFAERVGISRNTLKRLEEGDPNVSLGTYLRAMRVLGLETDLDSIASDDQLGRKLQDLKSLGHRATPVLPQP